MTEREKEKVESLQKQFGYAGINGVSEKDIIFLVRTNEETVEYKHTLYVDESGNYVDKKQDYDHVLDLNLKCRNDVDKDKIYFNKYDCSVLLKDSTTPINLAASVSYGNTFKPIELLKMAKNESAIERQFYNSHKNEFYTSWAYIDSRNVDNEGNKLIQRKNIDLDKLIKNSNIEMKDNPYVRAKVKDRFRQGELAEVTINYNGEEKRVMARLMPQFSSINYFSKEDMAAIFVSLANKESVAKSQKESQKLSNAQVTTDKVKQNTDKPAKQQRGQKKTV